MAAEAQWAELEQALWPPCDRGFGGLCDGTGCMCGAGEEADNHRSPPWERAQDRVQTLKAKKGFGAPPSAQAVMAAIQGSEAKFLNFRCSSTLSASDDDDGSSQGDQGNYREDMSCEELTDFIRSLNF